MKTRMIKRKGTLLSSVAVLGTAVLLTACGGDGGDSPVDDGGANPGESGAQALLYAYPDNGQGEVPTKAPIALRFTSAVSTGDVKQNVTLCCDDQGENLDFDVDKVDGEPRGVLLTPIDELSPGNQYTIEIVDLRLNKGIAKDESLTFTTRTLQQGPKSQVVQEVPAGTDEFQLSRTIPNGSELEPVMDFSAFRFQFTQPIDRATVSYGDGNSVVLRDSEGEQVEAGLLVDGAYMTVDPTDDYLTPGETYTLTLEGLESTYGESFAGETIEFIPKDSSPRGKPGLLVQRITQSGTSRLTGEAINQIPVNGTLLGEEGANFTQAQSDYVIAELADVTEYTEVTPIRLPKGTLLEGTPIEMIKIGGKVEAGFGSGDVTMRVLSDATGYLVPNPYTEKSPDQLRLVHLFMDVGIATENPKANGAFTQDLLHIHLVGVAEVDPDGGVLNIDATSMVEPDILGQEYGYGLLSFQLESYRDQTEGLVRDARAVLDTFSGFQFRSWSHGSDDTPSVSEPIVINFDKPLGDLASLDLDVQLFKHEGTGVSENVDVQVSTDGAALILDPVESLEPPTFAEDVLNDIEYQVVVSGDVSFNDTFRFPEVIDGLESWQSAVVRADGTYRFEESIEDATNGVVDPDDVLNQAPVPLSLFPGYPCVIDTTDQNLASGALGRCEDTLPQEYSRDGTFKPRDDILPIQKIGTGASIYVHFTKPIDSESVEYDSNFIVEQVDESGSFVRKMPGSISVEGKMISFTPDNPWAVGDNVFYKYTLRSNGDDIQAVNEPVCDGSQAICGEDGLPIQTKLYALSMLPEQMGGLIVHETADSAAGGPDIEIVFQAEKRPDTVVQNMSTNSVDTNANFYHDVNYELPPTAAADEGEGPGLTLFNYRTYNRNEEGVDPSNRVENPLPIDPNGIKPIANSAKLLSETEWVEQDASSGAIFPDPILNGLVVGCTYQVTEVGDDSIENGPFFGRECPESKFTYLHSALTVEIGGYDPDNDGIEVLIWPSQIIGTSINVATLTFNTGAVAIDSGTQLMRMRYAKDDPACVEQGGNTCQRSSPIVGYIKDGPNGKPVLEAEVDLYIDAPSLAEQLAFLGLGEMRHDLVSVPARVSLSGEVDFLPDGRIVVNQISQDPINIGFNLNVFLGVVNKAGSFDLLVPEQGTFLRYMGGSIK